MRTLQCLEYVRKARGKGYVVFKYRGQIRLAVHCRCYRLSVTQVASDHRGRERASSLGVSSLPVNVFIILFAQVAPVGCFKGFEVNVKLAELSGNCLEPGFRSWKVDDEALHSAEVTGHGRTGEPNASSEELLLAVRPKFVPSSELPTCRDAEYSENASSFPTSHSADWTLLEDMHQMSVYFDQVGWHWPDSGASRSVNALQQQLRQQEMMLGESEGDAIWIPERKA